MNKINFRYYFLSLFITLSAMPAHSALSPTSMNIRDLNVMVSFIEQHQKVADTLIRIEFETFTIVFENNCKAFFVRPKRGLVDYLVGKPGPQPAIEFASSTCPLSYDTKVQE